MKPNRRRLPLRHAVAALGVVAIGAIVATVPRPGEEPATERRGGPSAPPPARETAEQAGTVAPAASPASPSSAAPTATTVPAPVRAIDAPGVAAFPAGATPPVRIDPPAKPAPPPAKVVTRRLMPVAMETTAEFSIGEIRVRLPGVAIVSADEICRDRAGVAWPCGRRALAGVRAVVRGRAVDCPLPEKVRRGSFVVDCTLAGADLGERLIASGWARALDREGRLGEAERAAEAKGLGLHAAEAPNMVDALPAPKEAPPDTTTAPLGAVAGSPGAPLGAVAASPGAPLGAVAGSPGAPLGAAAVSPEASAGGASAPLPLGPAETPR
jgi:endonuclease YncB( thermonuclease family)